MRTEQAGTYIYIYIQTHTYSHTHIHTHTHTHTHTYINRTIKSIGRNTYITKTYSYK